MCVFSMTYFLKNIYKHMHLKIALLLWADCDSCPKSSHLPVCKEHPKPEPQPSFHRHLGLSSIPAA